MVSGRTHRWLFNTPSLFWRMFANPITVRELRVAGRSLRLFFALLASLAVQATVLMVVALSHVSDGTYENTAAAGRMAFIAQSIVMLISVVVIFPAFSSTAIAGERETGSLDMLTLSHLSTSEIVFGKLFSALVQASLFVVTAVPIYTLAVTFGGVPILALWFALGILFLLCMMISIVSVYASIVFRKRLASLIFSYVSAQALGLSVFVLGGAVMWDFIASSGKSIFGFGLLTAWEELFVAAAVIVTVGLYFVYFFMVAVARLKAGGQDKARALRLLSIFASVAAISTCFLAYHVSLRVKPSWLPYLQTAIPTILITSLVVPTIKGVGDTAFAPRVIRRSFERTRRSPLMRFVNWLLLPGSSSALVLAFVLSLGVFGAFGSLSNAVGNRLQEEAGISEVEKGVQAYANIWSLGSLRQSNPMTSNYDRNVKVDIISAEGQESVREFFRRGSRQVWRMAMVGLLAVVAFGLLAWCLSFTRASERVVPVILLIVFGLCTIPFLIQGVVSKYAPSIHVSYLSPVRAWQECISLTALDQLEAISQTVAHDTYIQKERADAYQRLLPSVGIMLLIAISSGTIGVATRRGAIRRREAANGRWPVPVLPPPAGTEVSESKEGEAGRLEDKATKVIEVRSAGNGEPEGGCAK